MARPTNEVKKHYIGVRLTDSEYEKLGENKSEAIRELINSVKQNGFVKQYPYDIDKLIESLERLVDTGDLVIFGSEVVMNTGFNVPDELKDELKNLSNACDEKGISVKDALRKTAQSIWSIRQ